jgi:hypothetical protein
MFCQWIHAECPVNKQFVANVLFADEVGFTVGNIVNFHDTTVWVDDICHTTVALEHSHWFSCDVWIDMLGDKNIGRFVIVNRLTGAVYPRFLVDDLIVLLEHMVHA